MSLHCSYIQSSRSAAAASANTRLTTPLRRRCSICLPHRLHLRQLQNLARLTQHQHTRVMATPAAAAAAAAAAAGGTAGAAAARTMAKAAATGDSGARGAHTIDWDAYNSRWADIWSGGLQKGQAFDKGECSPQLLHLISSGQLQVQGKKAFVPGCGRGYDVVAFAAAGTALAAGLDICPIAIDAAKAEQQQRLAGNATASAAVHLTAGDFFRHAQDPGFKGPYDIGYDYTFLCALHPDMRQDWARSWGQILAPGGTLVTMVYPTDASLGEGPPWPVTPELYRELLLLPAGFELVSLEPIPHQLSHESRAGREWLGTWKNSGAAAAAAQ